MSLYKRGTVWWIEFVVRGVRVRESTHTSNKDLAIRAERKRRNEIESMTNGIRKVHRPAAFVVAAKNWMEENEARWSASYKSIQGYSLKHLRPYFKRMLLQEINASHIGRYQRARKMQGASNRTINMEVSTLRMILKANDLWSHLGDKVRMLPERHSVGKALETEQVHQLLVACRNSPQPSLLTAVVIFANTAMRNAELRKARWEQVDFDHAQFRVGSAKNPSSEGRVVPLNRAALDALLSWKARWPEARPADFIFPSEKLVFKGKGSAALGSMKSYGVNRSKPLGSWKTAWRSVQKASGVKARIHDLRHHANTVMVESGTPIPTLKAITGHLTDAMVEHYTHIRDDARRKAVESLEGSSGMAIK